MICAANDQAAPSQHAPREILPQLSGLEPCSADLNTAVGDDASSREDLMVEICVAVADADGAQGLLQRLAALFDRSSVSFDATRNQVRVRSDSESRSVVRVLDAVQSWLAADSVDSAELSLGDRSYTMVGQSAGTRGASSNARR
jgi:hypothetical protein